MIHAPVNSHHSMAREVLDLGAERICKEWLSLMHIGIAVLGSFLVKQLGRV